MDFKQAALDNKEIKRQDLGIWYTAKEWMGVNYSSSSFNIDGQHAQITSPTIAHSRIITLEGVIERIGTDDGKAGVKYLQKLFALQANLYKTIDRELVVTDLWDKDRVLNVKVKEPLEIVKYTDIEIDNVAWSWRVVLESTYSPIYFSVIENEMDFKEGSYGGKTLGTTLGTPFNQISNEIILINDGNFPTPTRWEINIQNDVNDLKIVNLTNGTWFKLENLQAVVGDIIIIDSFNKTATKNGENVLNKRVQGSVWQMVQDETHFIVQDEDNAPANDFTGKVYFKDALL